MAWELVLWLLAFFAIMALIGMTAFQLICLSHLELDYVNPYDSASRINSVVIPEFVLQGLLCATFLFTWHWFPFLIMAPLTYYHMMLYTKRQHFIDVTEIFRLLNGEKKYRMVKLGFYVGLFLIIIFRLVMTTVTALIDEGAGPLESVIY